MSKKKIVERSRADYGTAPGQTIVAGMDDPMRVELEMPFRYAESLLDEFRVIHANVQADDDVVELRVDLPVRITLRRAQVQQVIEKIVAGIR